MDLGEHPDIAVEAWKLQVGGARRESVDVYVGVTERKRGDRAGRLMNAVVRSLGHLTGAGTIDARNNLDFKMVAALTNRSHSRC
jgi:hypothetical protein